MDEISSIISNPLSIATVGTLVLYLITHFARKAWQNVTEAALETTATTAESVVIGLMKGQIISLTHELAEMKLCNQQDLQRLRDDFSKDRLALQDQIRELQHEILATNEKLHNMKVIAMDMYYYTTTISMGDNERKTIKAHLDKLIRDTK